MRQLDTPGGQVGIATDGCQYLSFTLGAEEYGVPILDVQEIRRYSTVTPVPNTPAWVKGVMSLRGTIIPVADLRAKLAMPAAAQSPFTVIIVVRLGARVLGILVDAVTDVLNIPLADIRSAPDLATGAESEVVSGMAKAGDRLLVLLDLARIFSAEEVGSVVTGAYLERPEVGC